MRKLNYSEFKLELVKNKDSFMKDYLIEKFNILQNDIPEEELLEIIAYKQQTPNIEEGFTLNVNGLYQSYKQNKENNIVPFMKKKLKAITEIEKPVADEINTKLIKASKNLTFKLLNLALHAALLKDRPYDVWNDLAICYQIPVAGGSIQLTNDLMGKVGLKTEELFDYALKNMREVNSPVIRPMFDVMVDLANDPELEGTAEAQAIKEDLANMPKDVMGNLLPPMLSVSTVNKCYGAASILLPSVREELAERLGGDYYVIPSSVHEMLAISVEDVPNVKYLIEQIAFINNKHVPEQNRLSYNAYHYDAKTKELTMIDAKDYEYDLNKEQDEYELDEF